MRLVEVQPTVDFAFKWLFGVKGREPILTHVINAVCAPTLPRPITRIDFENPFDERAFEEDKLSILDIRARDNEDQIYNIEMQMNALRMYLARALYYWAGSYHGQLHEGDSYDKLRPTIGIHFVDSKLFDQTDDYHSMFELRERKRPKLIYSNHLQLHVIELPKFTADVNSLRTPLDFWLYLLRHGATLDLDALPVGFQMPIMKEALEVLWTMSNTPSQRMLYESRLKQRRDYDYGMATAKQEGEQRGLLEGIRLSLEIRFGVQGLTLLPLVEKAGSIERLRQMADQLKITDSFTVLADKWSKM